MKHLKKLKFMHAFILAPLISLNAGVLIPNASFLGTHVEERVGYVISEAGDVNGDGFEDFIIGNFHNNKYGRYAGSVYLILGRSTIDWGMDYSLRNVDAIFYGDDGDAVGYSIGGGGDVNGDGLDDIIIGAAQNQYNDKGCAYIIFGDMAADWGNNFILSTSADIKISGEHDGSSFGKAVDIIGDMNDDGYDDILIGSLSYDDPKDNVGKVYLFLGMETGWQNNSNGSQANAKFIINSQDALLGYSVSGTGDVNNDGFDDFIMGARGLSKEYFFFGQNVVDWGNSYNVSGADVIYHGEDNGDWVGWRSAPAGDVNGDGYDDFLIGAPHNDTGHTDAGKIYVIFGKQSGWSNNVYLSNADASFVGENDSDMIGWCVSQVSDLNMDGCDEILAGSRHFDNQKGKMYVIFGNANGWGQNYDFSNVQDYFIGEHNEDYSGYDICSIDINNDGIKDIVTSAPINSESYTKAGQIYLFNSSVNFDVPSIISGYVYHAISGESIQDVTLDLTGGMTLQTTTDGNGEYLFSVDDNLDYIVNPVENPAISKYTSSITSYDAALTARFVVGLENFDQIQRSASDVDQDDCISSFDAVLIARYVVGFPNLMVSHVGEWRFEPEYREYFDVDERFTNQNFDAWLLGDVDGSLEITAYKDMDCHVNQWEWFEVLEDQDQSVDIKFTNQNGMPLISADFELIYDATDFEVTSIFLEEDCKAMNLFFNNCDKGRLRVCIYGIEPVQHDGVFLTISLSRNQKNLTDPAFFINYLRINNSQNLSDIQTGLLTVNSNYPSTVKLSCSPNPFNASVDVFYAVKLKSRVYIHIFDLFGRSIKILVNENKNIGEYRVNWDGKDFIEQEVPSGIYFIVLQLNSDQYIHKVIKLK